MNSQDPLRFDGRVAVITGAGGGNFLINCDKFQFFKIYLFILTTFPIYNFSLLAGLGKEYALLLASRGAAVVGEPSPNCFSTFL